MKKNKKQNLVPKFGFGTVIESPEDALIESQTGRARAQVIGMNDKTAGAVKIGGMVLQTVGNSLMQGSGGPKGTAPGATGMSGFVQNNMGTIMSGANSVSGMANSFAFGGDVPGAVPVEVEGNEVGQTPDGSLLEFIGPSHENGGIDTMLPPGTEMYSNRIKVDGVTMADRKKGREKQEMTLENLLKKSKMDSLLQKSLERTKERNAIIEEADNKIQHTVKNAMEGSQSVHAWGDTVGGGDEELFSDIYGGSMMYDGRSGFIAPNRQPLTPANVSSVGVTPTNIGTPNGGISNNTGRELLTPASIESIGITGMSPSSIMPNYKLADTPGTEESSKENGKISDYIPNISLGDAVGLASNLYGANANMKNTLKNRAGDTPNKNAFKNYGKEGLKTMEDAAQFLAQLKAQKIKDTELSRASTIKRNSGSARSMSVINALNLAADANANNILEQIHGNHAEGMLGITNKKADMQNNIDQVVMTGEQNKDLADRQDRDQFFSNMAKDITTKIEAGQELSYDLNKMKEGKDSVNLVNQLSKYGYAIDPITGKLYMKGAKTGTTKSTTSKKAAPTKTYTQEEMIEAIQAAQAAGLI